MKLFLCAIFFMKSKGFPIYSVHGWILNNDESVSFIFVISADSADNVYQTRKHLSKGCEHPFLYTKEMDSINVQWHS